MTDFTSQGYRIVRELGYNLNGGRVTYLAQRISTGEEVVIKEFQFARSQQQSWSGFKAYEREIQVLKGLNHPGIPSYLDSFETSSGFCMVQEYKQAQPLSLPRSFAADEIKQVAICVLQILIYLQNRLPPVFHRDIKPENILIDDQMRVYLIDFGFARIGSQDMAMSSVALGTLGFMAPEQIYHRELTNATDLYGLGATLVCLVTGVKSTAMHTLINEDGCIAFKHLLPQLSHRFVDWLETMVQPKVKNRFEDASQALIALKPIDVICLPQVKLDKDNLEFTADEINQKLTQTITINNPASDTILQGWWEVAPHPNDPPHTPDSHSWILFSDKSFSSNNIQCKIIIDTSQLIAAKLYHRQLLLHTNSASEIYKVKITIQTASLPIANYQPPYISLLFLLITSGAMTWTGSVVAAIIAAILMTIIGAGIVAVNDIVFGAAVGSLIASFVGVALGPVFGAVISAIVAIEVWCVAKGLLISKLKIYQPPASKGLSQFIGIAMVLLTSGLGVSLGIGLKIGFTNLSVVAASFLSGSILAGFLIYPPIRQRRLVSKYRQSEEFLIKP